MTGVSCQSKWNKEAKSECVCARAGEKPQKGTVALVGLAQPCSPLTAPGMTHSLFALWGFCQCRRVGQRRWCESGSSRSGRHTPFLPRNVSGDVGKRAHFFSVCFAPSVCAEGALLSLPHKVPLCGKTFLSIRPTYGCNLLFLPLGCHKFGGHHLHAAAVQLSFSIKLL